MALDDDIRNDRVFASLGHWMTKWGKAPSQITHFKNIWTPVWAQNKLYYVHLLKLGGLFVATASVTLANTWAVYFIGGDRQKQNK